MAENRSNIAWWIFGVTVVALPFLFYLIIGGRVDGEEFSPDDFSRRYFSYNIMPIFKICLRGIEYHDKTPVFEQTLLADGYLGKNVANSDSTRSWHLVYDSASDLESRDFDARLLIRFLDLLDDQYESIWIKWNEDYPQLANSFWPIVADLARNYLYVELTEIMARARVLSDDQIDEFEQFMLAKASTAFLNLAEQRKADGDFKGALELYQNSNDLLPSQRAAAGRVQCLDQLGKINTGSMNDVQAEVEEE